MGKQTVGNVDDFFKHEYKRYISLNMMSTEISSPELSDLPRQRATADSMFNRMTNIAHASTVIEAVNNVVSSIPDEKGRQVLKWFLDGHTWFEVEMLSGYSHSWVAKKRLVAYDWFALLFDQVYPDLLEPFVID